LWSISPKLFSTARFLHHFPGSSPSHGSTGLCPYIPSSYLSKVWRPIAFSGRVKAFNIKTYRGTTLRHWAIKKTAMGAKMASATCPSTGRITDFSYNPGAIISLCSDATLASSFWVTTLSVYKTIVIRQPPLCIALQKTNKPNTILMIWCWVF
jgi:hypothetical protein